MRRHLFCWVLVLGIASWAHELSAEPQCWVQNETDAVDVRARANQTGLQIRVGVPLASGVVLKYGCQIEK
mgnify:CR=1 FL=1